VLIVLTKVDGQSKQIRLASTFDSRFRSGQNPHRRLACRGRNQGREVAEGGLQGQQGQEGHELPVGLVGCSAMRKEIGIELFGAHDLHRTCAKLCRKRRRSRADQFLLGHSWIQTTERYLGSEEEIAIAVMIR